MEKIFFNLKEIIIQKCTVIKKQMFFKNCILKLVEVLGFCTWEEIKKYGEVIGVATSDILRGNHVHVHNIKSKQRGEAS